MSIIRLCVSCLQVKAGVPERLMELALVSVAHFEPVEVQVLIEGTYPMLSFNLPRIKDEAFLDALAFARSRSAPCPGPSMPAEHTSFGWACFLQPALLMPIPRFLTSMTGSACSQHWRHVDGVQLCTVTPHHTCPLTMAVFWSHMGPAVLLRSSKEHELAVQVQKPFDPQQPGRATSPLAGARASFGGVARGSVGPGSIAATAVSAGTVAGRPGSGAKSQISGMSAVSAAKSKTSLASAITAGTILAKDKLAQVGACCSCLAAPIC